MSHQERDATMSSESPKPPHDTEASLALARLAQSLDRSALPALASLATSLDSEIRQRAHARRVRHLLYSIVAVFMLVLGVYVVPRLSDAFVEAYGRPHVAVVALEGSIGGGGVLTADRVVPMLTAICENRGLNGLVVRIQSPGGSPADAERIGAALRRCRGQVAAAGGRAYRPVIAAIDGIGASAAYWIAVEADRIVATESTMVGSIGAVISYLEWSSTIERLGITSHTYASGELKAIFSPWRAPREAEQALGQTIVNDAMAVFRRKVQERRPATASAAPDDALWSGRVWLASEARQLGLVDEIGVLEDVVAAEFPGLPVRYSKPRRNFREEMSAESFVDAAFRLAAPPPMVTP